MGIRLKIENVPLPLSWSGDKPLLRIGRNPESDLVFDGEASPTVSWDHALIEMKPGHVFLSDLGSTNGTFVNGAAVTSRTVLRAGDEILLGKEGPRLRVLEIAAAEPAAEAPRDRKPLSAATPPSADSPFRWPMIALAASALVLVLGIWWVASKFATANSAPQAADKREEVPIPQPPPPPPPPPPPRSLTPEEIAGKYAAGVVWLGIENKGRILPYCTGFAITKRQIATSAFHVYWLQKDREAGRRVVAGIGGDKAEPYDLREFRFHSDFNPDTPDSDTSLASSVGYVTIDQDLPVACPLLPEKELPSQIIGHSGVLVGFDIPGGEKTTAFSEITKPRQLHFSTEVRAAIVTPGGGRHVFTIELPQADGCEGGPIFDLQGRIWGVYLGKAKEKHFVAPAHLLIPMKRS